MDTKVRSAWEIDANQLSFNDNWRDFLNGAIENIKIDLGLEDYVISAHCYKLLIYEKDDFFLPHKDSEKEKGMFGSLIIGLPSTYKGGELVISFDGAREIADFSKNSYALNYTAFYADCDHEVKRLTSGYRVCLVYNLIQEKAGKKNRSTVYSELC